MTKEEALKEAQELLDRARKLMDRVTVLAAQHELDNLSFMNMTWHSTMTRWGETRQLCDPAWFDNEYWLSSTGDCEIGVIYKNEEEEP